MARGQFAELPEKDAYRDHRRLIERKDMDAILVTAVDNWHGPCTLEGLGRRQTRLL
jgi:hypothetical protein